MTLYVPSNVLYDEVHLDRFVESIQSARFVFSGRLHPLLCSLPSAEAVAYTEQMKDLEMFDSAEVDKIPSATTTTTRANTRENSEAEGFERDRSRSRGRY